MEALDNELYKKNPENVERPPDIIKAIEDGTVDLGVAPDSIANILGVRVDYESNPILMYPADPYSWGRHLLGDKTWQNGNLYLTTYGYTTEYSGGGTNACAVPYYWSDVKKVIQYVLEIWKTKLMLLQAIEVILDQIKKGRRSHM